jgi:molybdenum cofactor cytidylyltransferase
MNGVTAILLAAGLSKRFGAANKLLEKIDGEAMVRRVAVAVCASKAMRIVVVLGHEADLIADALSGLALETVLNSDFGDGQISSVRVGVRAVGDDATGFMMCLGDQPLLTSADYDALIDAFSEQPDRVLVPFLAGKRGNPVILPIALRDDILAGGVNVGCRQFIDSHPQLVHRLDVSNPGYRNDFDTPEHFTKNQQAT